MTSAAFPPFAALGTPSNGQGQRRGRPGMGWAVHTLTDPGLSGAASRAGRIRVSSAASGVNSGRGGRYGVTAPPQLSADGSQARTSNLFQKLFQQVCRLLGIALGAAVQAAQRLFVSSSRRPATVRGYGKFDHLINQVALVLVLHLASSRGTR